MPVRANPLAMLTNHNHFEEDSNFDQLEPRYDISAVEIEEYIKGLLVHTS